MDSQTQEQYEQYEYARKRIKQKKGLYFHFVLFLLGSLFMFIANKFLDIEPTKNWFLWGATAWFFILILHFIKVYITDRFMNKNWERAQIDRLITLQQKRMAQLQAHVNEQNDSHKL